MAELLASIGEAGQSSRSVQSPASGSFALSEAQNVRSSECPKLRISDAQALRSQIDVLWQRLQSLLVPMTEAHDFRPKQLMSLMGAILPEGSMTTDTLTTLIFFGGLGQLSILTAAAIVPFQLNWKEVLAPLPRLHQQMYLVYGGYIVLAIIALGLLSVIYCQELAAGSPLARGVCCYVGVFWGFRLTLQPVFDVKDYLTTWWLTAGYHALTVLFLCLTILFLYAAFRPPSSS